MRMSGAEPGPSRDDLEHRPVPQDGLVCVTAEDEPRPAGPRRAARLDAPAAAHPQVAPHRDAAFEPEEQVLADRFHRLEPASVDPRGDARDLRARVRALGLDALAHEHGEPPCGPVQRVAFGHAGTVAGGRRPTWAG
ncbi:MAG TPA: hypothetical protein VGQ15_06235 [Gaiellaceae bacterium]|nr:hypothetical protein [Gaiellaceae bacterium]